MQSILENRSWARMAAALAILGHFPAAMTYVLVPMLIGPPAITYTLGAVWIALLGTAIYWFRAHPWRSAVLLAIGFVVVQVFVIFGDRYLGWNP